MGFVVRLASAAGAAAERRKLPWSKRAARCRDTATVCLAPVPRFPKFALWLVVLTGSLGLVVSACAAGGLIANGGYEARLQGWSQFWSREAGAGQAELETNEVHSGRTALQVVHRGEQDWSYSTDQRLPVRAGDIYSLEGWAKAQGPGDATLGVIAYDREGRAVDWVLGGRSVRDAKDWTVLRSRFVIPSKVTSILPRWIGHGNVTAWLDDVSLRRTGSLAELRRADLPAELALTNALLAVELRTADGTISVHDTRAGKSWAQQSMAQDWVVKDARVGAQLEIDFLHISSGQEFKAVLRLEPNLPELTITLSGDGELAAPLRYPHPFVSEPGTYLVVPMNEGISYPVEDDSISPMRLITYGGHGICMGFWGVTDGERGQMAIIETADDAAIRIDRVDGKLYVAPEWDPQKGQFGYARKLRYVFFDHGGYVAMAKHYRAYAQRIGRFKTLAQKRQENPNVDQLIGAVNVWCWDRDSVDLVREMKARGINHILWSNRQSPENLRALNALGVLTSRYDIYQDVMNPDNFKHLRGTHGDWVTAAWPKDIVIDANGNWLRGWRVKGTDGQWYPCGVICDKQAPVYAAQRIPAELADHPYRCRFIDTTTAAPWHECYAPAHPMTRTESRQWKMKLLEYVSHDMKLVTGCETGHDAAVPYLHYFEGMLSLGPYRVPDAGRDMMRVWDDVPERVAKFQLGHRYRLPLWELVYHDCVVAQWYWGDYNNKLPALWDKRDLFNALYGTPPMFMFNRQRWEANQDRFVQSYQTTCPIARATGYSEMTDHRFLTPNRDVQQTTFANGVTVTVNFGARPYHPETGNDLPPHRMSVKGPGF